MNNREKYKQTFSAIHISDEFSLEVKNMKTKNHKLKLHRLAACIAACVLIMGCATAAYATDFCGIQRTIQLWIHGDQTEVVIQFDGKGNYNMEYSDNEGNMYQQGGGGVSISDDGTEIPLSEEELMEQLMAPDVQYEDDGSVWVYWFDQKIDITNNFKDDVCYIQLVNDEEVLYMTVKYQNGYATSPDKYLSPSTFN